MSYHNDLKTKKEISQALAGFLADSMVAYYKTHVFHWNVEDANFYGLHLLFEKFYEDLWKSLDDIAERIRALGEKITPSLQGLLKTTSLKEIGTLPAAPIMIHMLYEDYILLAQQALDVAKIAEKHGDLLTMDMMTERAQILEKAAWMLHSTFVQD